MLEIPESAVIAQQINGMLRGKTIESVEANPSPHRFACYFGDPSKLRRRAGELSLAME